MSGEGQMPTTGQIDSLGLCNSLPQFLQTASRYKDVAVAGQDQRGHADLVKAMMHVVAADHLEAMRHHALIGLPNLPRDKINQLFRLLWPAKQKIEKLIDELGIVRQRKTR